MVYRSCRNKQLNEICESISEELLRSFLKNRYGEKKPINISEFAIEYLHLNIGYDNLSPDKSVCGQICNDSIIVDYGLPNTGRIRFTIAHECAHYLINNSIYIRNEDLFGDYEACEMIADKIASCLLMPRYLMEYSVEYANIKLPLTIYDRYTLKGYDYRNTKSASNLLKVSRSAYINRLKDLGAVNYGDREIGRLIPVIL